MGLGTSGFRTFKGDCLFFLAGAALVFGGETLNPKS